MATIIHCVKTKESTMFRLWNTNGDYYVTPPLTREQILAAAVFYFAAVAVDRVLWQEVDSTERALQLAELHGIPVSLRAGGRSSGTLRSVRPKSLLISC